LSEIATTIFIIAFCAYGPFLLVPEIWRSLQSGVWHTQRSDLTRLDQPKRYWTAIGFMSAITLICLFALWLSVVHDIARAIEHFN
jgi:hypothetical protein